MQKKLLITVLFIAVSALLGCSERGTVEPNDDGLLVIPPSESNIQVLTPLNDQTVKPNTELHIEWIHTGNMEKVDIVLYRKREFMRPIAYDLDNEGSYLWKVPADLPSSHHYRIEVRNGYNDADAEFSYYFFIPPFN